MLSAVLSRDTLLVPHEGFVLDALQRWSTAECRRRMLPLTLTGRRQVLGGMLTLPRLLTLSSRQISKMEGLYESYEIAFIKARVKQERQSIPVPPLFADRLEYMAQIRLAKGKINTNAGIIFPKKFFKKKDMILDLVSVLALVID